MPFDRSVACHKPSTGLALGPIWRCFWDPLSGAGVPRRFCGSLPQDLNSFPAPSHGEGLTMNNAQRLVVITALVLIGAVLAWLLLDWEDGWQSGLPVLVFYDAQLPNYQNLTGHYGIYARYGVPPILA